MRKFLRFSLVMTLLLICGHAFAQKVTLDFTSNTWGLPEGSTNKGTKSQVFNNGTYNITLSASTGYYFNTDGYLMLGKSGSTLTLQAFDFDVAKIEVVGRAGASGSTKQNIYVGETAVSTETIGATSTNTYEIDAAHQAKGTIYTLKVTSAHNTQITQIKIYEATSLQSAGLSFSQSSISIKAGTEFTAPTFTKKTDATVTFATDNAEVATVSNDGVISLAGGIGTATITATSPATSSYEAGNATCKIEVYAVNVYKKATSITSGESYLLVAQRDDATRYAIPLKDTYSYGYLSTSNISGLTETIEVNKKYDDGFVLTAMDGGYSIKDCYGRYLYQSGTHNSFNVGETPQAWTIESQADGTFKISMNGYFMQYGQGTYTTFGVYTEAQDGAVLPMLYKFDDKATGIDTINGNSEVVRATGTYNLAGQRVDSSYKGIVIKNGKKVLVK